MGGKYGLHNKAREAEIEREQKIHEAEAAETLASAAPVKKKGQPGKQPSTEEERKERQTKYATVAIDRKEAGKAGRIKAAPSAGS